LLTFYNLSFTWLKIHIAIAILSVTDTTKVSPVFL
jgi:hypothetical protein